MILFSSISKKIEGDEGVVMISSKICLLFSIGLWEHSGTIYVFSGHNSKPVSLGVMETFIPKTKLMSNIFFLAMSLFAKYSFQYTPVSNSNVLFD